MTLLLLLRVMPFLKWRIVSQTTLATFPPKKDSVTRGTLVVVATWGGVLMLLKDSWPWPKVATGFRQSSGDLFSASGIATIFGAVALVVTVLAVGLTLTRLADWMFYRRRWTLPLLVILVMGAAIGLLLSFGGPFRSGTDWLLAAWWLFLGLATQPLTTLLVMGMAGYRLAPRKPPEPQASEPAPETPQTTTTQRAENWLFRLQRVHFAAPVTALVFLGWIGLTGLWNDHFVSVFLATVERTAAGEIHRLAAKSSVTDAKLVHLKGMTNLQTLFLGRCLAVTDAGLVQLKGLTKLQAFYISGANITDAGLVHLTEMTNLQNLNLEGTPITDAGLVHLKDLTNLKKLDLRDTTITDAGLVHLKGLTNLKKLWLEETKVSDAGLVHLKEMTSLEMLWLHGTQITDAGIAELRTALPDCKVTQKAF